MSLRLVDRPAKRGYQHPRDQREPLSTEERVAVEHALGRGYPIAKRLAEVLELEAESDPDIAGLAAQAVRIRRTLGELLAEYGGSR